MARLVIDFRRELHYPGAVEVGSRLTRLGRKSLTTGYGIFAGDACIATSEAVNVFYDMATRRSTVAGVNLDEELSRLVLFQEAYSVSARVLAITNQLFDELLAVVD